MAYDQIIYEAAEGVATVTLNRPDRLNAWTPVMEEEVRQAMSEATADKDVRVIVLTGAGRGFCAGADMQRLDNASQTKVRRLDSNDRLANTRADAYSAGTVPGGNDLPQAFAYKHAYFPTVPKPIIAALNGPVAGLGLVIALWADIRFASESAVFSTGFARRGLVAEHGIDWILPRVVGFPNALDLLISARKIGASEALDMGLVNKTFPHDDFVGQVRDYALDLANNVSPRSMRVIKNQLFRAQDLDLGSALHASLKDMVESFASDDFREGVEHFVQKRPPNFTGQ